MTKEVNPEPPALSLGLPDIASGVRLKVPPRIANRVAQIAMEINARLLVVSTTLALSEVNYRPDIDGVDFVVTAHLDRGNVVPTTQLLITEEMIEDYDISSPQMSGQLDRLIVRARGLVTNPG